MCWIRRRLRAAERSRGTEPASLEPWPAWSAASSSRWLAGPLIWYRLGPIQVVTGVSLFPVALLFGGAVVTPASWRRSVPGRPCGDVVANLRIHGLCPRRHYRITAFAVVLIATRLNRLVADVYPKPRLCLPDTDAASSAHLGTSWVSGASDASRRRRRAGAAPQDFWLRARSVRRACRVHRVDLWWVGICSTRTTAACPRAATVDSSSDLRSTSDGALVRACSIFASVMMRLPRW